MGPSKPPALAIDPSFGVQSQQIEQDKIEAIRDRLSSETRSILVRFGRLKAFAGAGQSGLPSAPGALGLPVVQGI